MSEVDGAWPHADECCAARQAEARDGDDAMFVGAPNKARPAKKKKRAGTFSEALGLSQDEREFFAAGDDLADAPVIPVEDFSDLDPVEMRRPSRGTPRAKRISSQRLAQWWADAKGQLAETRQRASAGIRPFWLRTREGLAELLIQTRQRVRALVGSGKKLKQPRQLKAWLPLAVPDSIRQRPASPKTERVDEMPSARRAGKKRVTRAKKSRKAREKRRR